MTNQEILLGLSKFYENYKNTVIASDIASIRKEFLALRDQVEKKYSEDPFFNHPIYTSDSFDFDMNQMLDESQQLIDLLLTKKLDE